LAIAVSLGARHTPAASSLCPYSPKMVWICSAFAGCYRIPVGFADCIGGRLHLWPTVLEEQRTHAAAAVLMEHETVLEQSNTWAPPLGDLSHSDTRVYRRFCCGWGTRKRRSSARVFTRMRFFVSMVLCNSFLDGPHSSKQGTLNGTTTAAWTSANRATAAGIRGGTPRS
jgi:hypothetical protein